MMMKWGDDDNDNVYPETLQETEKYDGKKEWNPTSSYQRASQLLIWCCSK